jgi:hypothetical protein
MASTGKIEQLMQDIRKTPIFRQLIPMEAQIGWPIPLRREGKVYVTLPFFGSSTKTPGKTILFPPFAKMTLEWSTLLIVEYVNFRFQNPFSEVKWEQPIGTFPHPAVTNMTVEEYQAKRHELLIMYDEMLEHLLKGQNLSPDWNQKFSQILRLMMEPDLETYYQALGAKFFGRFLTQ